MAKVPTVLDVPNGIFEATEKFSSSVAMVLDRNDPDRDTGSVEWSMNVREYIIRNVGDAYNIVHTYIEAVRDTLNKESNPDVSWWDAETLIEMLAGAPAWLVYTDEQGFVSTKPFESVSEADEAYLEWDRKYIEWLLTPVQL